MRRTVCCLVYVFLAALSLPSQAQNYIVIGWNDLGMHCANKDFSTLAVLPPYNNIHAQVIRIGNGSENPQIVTTDMQVTYEIPGNTYSVGKTNFWDYEEQLFGVSLADNIGLTGAGLSGTMNVSGTSFVIEGVPVTPYTDSNLITEDAYQLALLKVVMNSQVVAETQPVVPVSNEISCVSSGCHTSEADILARHESEGGFNPANTPILCASCHASPALGTTGTGEAPVFSDAIHTRHGELTNDCYKCHPGNITKCLRGVMSTQFDLQCQDCHGSVMNVGLSVRQGRTPWLQEPSCGAISCHGEQYAEEPGLLFRQSKGHGGLYCSACHGSPHAILPSGVARDNVQNVTLQGYAGILRDCTVCHGVVPGSPGPHGYVPVSVEEGADEPLEFSLLPNYPNPFNPVTTITFELATGGPVTLSVLNEIGQTVTVLAERQYYPPGTYQRTFDAGNLAAGTYHIVLEMNGIIKTQKMTLLK